MLTFLFVVVVGLVIVAAIVAAIVVNRLQRQSLRRKLRVEINNQGNVRSRYELRAEDSLGALGFQFELDGDPLPPSDLVEVTQAPEAQKAAKSDSWILPPDSDKLKSGAGAAMKTSGEAANTLGSLGMLLPKSVRMPLLQAASSLRRGQSAGMQAERLSKRASKVKKPGAGAKAAPAPRGAQTEVQVWVQTPYVQPGDGLAVDLLVNLLRSAAVPDHAFALISRSVEQEAAPTVVAEGSVRIAQPSLFRRLLPYALIFVVTVGILAFAAWLASTGVLG